jgi:hypothetical protein
MGILEHLFGAVIKSDRLAEWVIMKSLGHS